MRGRTAERVRDGAGGVVLSPPDLAEWRATCLLHRSGRVRDVWHHGLAV